jgi:hypothetical protein
VLTETRACERLRARSYDPTSFHALTQIVTAHGGHVVGDWPVAFITSRPRADGLALDRQHIMWTGSGIAAGAAMTPIHMVRPLIRHLAPKSVRLMISTAGIVTVGSSLVTTVVPQVGGLVSPARWAKSRRSRSVP